MVRSSTPSIGQLVRFRRQEREVTGILARRVGDLGFILGDDRQSYQVPLASLQPLLSRPPSPQEFGRDRSRAIDSRNTAPVSALSVQVGDSVDFVFKKRRLNGSVVRLNPRRAHVLGQDKREYAVPYARLQRLTAGAASRQRDLAVVRQLAASLLVRHGLQEWCFDFDHATRRAGCCDYRRRRITLALQFARQADDQQLLETLLHEIAHALVGPKHHHDVHWRAKALEIGASGERCHQLRFHPPRYLVTCANGCWIATAERRRHRIVCRRCSGDIVYQTYTEQRWQEAEQAFGEKH